MDQERIDHTNLGHLLTQVGTFPNHPGMVSFVVARGAALNEQLSDDRLLISIFDDPPYGDAHNDLFIMSWVDKDGNGKLEAVSCTSHPSRRYTNRPAKPAGAAWLPTYTMFHYQRGTHRQRSAFNMVDFLNYVVRDTDQDGEISVGDTLDTGYFGVNIHPGEQSAGCIVISGNWHGDNWKQVVAWHDSEQKLFPTMVIEGMDIHRWVKGNDWYKKNEWCPEIGFGTKNEWVGRLQEKINEHGAFCKIDNHWGPKTQDAYEKVLIEMDYPALPYLSVGVWSEMQN